MRTPTTLAEGIALVESLVSRGGPSVADYALLDAVMRLLPTLTPAQVAAVRVAFGEAMRNTEAMQAFAYVKPRGCAGDFEIIDRIYRERVTSHPGLAAWDRYFHAQPAFRAVRNRKTYFHALLDRHAGRRRPLRVLNLASGPGRCMAEWLTMHPELSATFTCVELDPAAIAHARHLTRGFSDRVTFVHQNLLRFMPHATYDLIWAAGSCDYFSETLFARLIRRMVPALAPGGELVAGNFSGTNPTRPYMEILGEWRLHHRSSHTLRQIAAAAEVPPARVSIGAEPAGINLFLHIAAPAA